MRFRKQLTVMSILIIILALGASIWGILPGTGEPFDFTSIYGENVEVNGSGLYKHDSISYTAQARAQDYVTIFLGIPLLAVSLILAGKNSFRGKLLLTGTLGYFLYTYISYCFLVSFNQLFLIYVSLFALSLYAFIYAFLELDVAAIKEHFTEKYPAKGIAVFLLIIAAMLVFMWSGKILPAMDGKTAPAGLEIYTTLVIQAMDLALIVPAAVFAGIALLRKKAIGYALASIVVMKGLTMFTAVSVMAFVLYFTGADISPVELIVFPVPAFINIFVTVVILRSVRQ